MVYSFVYTTEKFFLTLVPKTALYFLTLAFWFYYSLEGRSPDSESKESEAKFLFCLSLAVRIFHPSVSSLTVSQALKTPMREVMSRLCCWENGYSERWDYPRGDMQPDTDSPVLSLISLTSHQFTQNITILFLYNIVQYVLLSWGGRLQLSPKESVVHFYLQTCILTLVFKLPVGSAWYSEPVMSSEDLVIICGSFKDTTKGQGLADSLSSGTYKGQGVQRENRSHLLLD